jgi:hypothetical protein
MSSPIESQLAHLRSLGFDRSRASLDYVRVLCSQCEALVINGVPCHEAGCPNRPGDDEDDDTDADDNEDFTDPFSDDEDEDDDDPDDEDFDPCEETTCPE